MRYLLRKWRLRPTTHPKHPRPEGHGLPDDPGQEALPIAQPEPIPRGGIPVEWKADRQTWAGHTATLYGVEEFHYRDYVLRADKVVYNQETSELEAEGHLQMSGGPDDIVLTASHGDMRLNMHTARFYDVTGTIGVRRAGRTIVYSTPNPFLFSARVLLQTGEGTYKIVDGTMTNCRLPKPDWQLLARQINIAEGKASTKNTIFKLLGVPIFDLPYLSRPVDETGRVSGLLTPVFSVGSSIRGFTAGEQAYIVLNRSMDMILGLEYYSKRGWAPNGDFRYKGPGLDHLTARWNALIDRGFEQLQTSGPQAGQTIYVNQGGVDILALGRKDLTPDTRVAGNVEYLSSYVYRLVFNDNYWQAISSEVSSEAYLAHVHNGLVPSLWIGRLQNFAGSTEGDEVRILHLPSVRFDVLDEPVGASPLYWGLGSSIEHLGRSEPDFHAHNLGRFDLYPHISLPIVGGGWSIVPEAGARLTFYTGSQTPELTAQNGGTPTVSHDPLRRTYAEASVDVRPPALERDFILGGCNRVLRHVIEPELTYHFVGGIGSQERNVLTIDTTDIVTDTNEVGYSLTQRFYLRPMLPKQCDPDAAPDAKGCSAPARVGQLADRAEIFLQRQFRRRAHPLPAQCIRHHARSERNCLSHPAAQPVARHLPLAVRGHRQPAHPVGPGLRSQSRPPGRQQPLRRLQLGRHHHRDRPLAAQRRGRNGQRRLDHPEQPGGAVPANRQTAESRLQPGRQRRL